MTGTRDRVIVGIDDTAAGVAALRWAVSEARLRRGELIAVRTSRAGAGGQRRTPILAREGRIRRFLPCPGHADARGRNLERAPRREKARPDEDGHTAAVAS